ITIGPVEVGDYEIVLYASTKGSDRWGDRIAVSSDSITIVAGDNSSTLSIPPLYSLTVHFPDTKVRNSVNLKSVARAGRSVQIYREIDDSGTVVYENLPAGEYLLSSYGGGLPGVMHLHVPAQTNVTFQSEPQNALLVTVTDPADALATTAFQDGDLIVATHASDVSNILHLPTAAMHAMTELKSAVR